MSKTPLDRGALLAYWSIKLADAVEGDDPLMADAARHQIQAIGFDVRTLPGAGKRLRVAVRSHLPSQPRQASAR